MSDGPEHDIETEMAVLGSMMLSPDALNDVLEVIRKPGDFIRPAHQMIYAAMADMAAEGLPVDIVTVRAEVERRGQTATTGTGTYLHTLIASVPVAASAASYAREVREIAAQRDYTRVAVTIREIARDPALNSGERAELAQKALDDAAGSAVKARARSAAELIGPLIERMESGAVAEQGVRSGWTDLDAHIPGFRPGELVVVGARPGMGKSLVMLQMAVRAALDDHLPALVCSLEMSWEDCMQRVLAAEASVSLSAIRDGNLTDHDWDRIAKAHGRIADAGTLMITDDPYMTITDIRAELRAMRRAGHPAAMVIIDYLQLMQSGRRSENRQVEVSQFSRALKLMAKEFDVPVIVGSQLNRGPEMRSDKRPLLADLRESGSLEQDSDIVLLLYRDELYVRESPQAGEIELHVAKNRQGQSGVTATLAFRGHYAEVSNMYRYVPSDRRAS